MQNYLEEKNYKVILHKPIIVPGILNFTEFIKLVETECYSYFIVDIGGSRVKITIDSFNPKNKSLNLLKEQKFQLYTVTWLTNSY